MYLRLFILLAGIAFLFSCKAKKEDPATAEKNRIEGNYRENIKKLDSLKALVRNGDLVTRCSNAWDSEHIKEFQQKDKSYTHAGIAKIENGKILICHIMARDSVYQTDGAVQESIDSFLNPRVYIAFGLFRFDITSDQAAQVVSYMDECYKNKVAFDYRFDYRFDNPNGRDTAMYCSEMIVKALAGATNNAYTFTTTKITDRKQINQVKRYFRKYHMTEQEIVTKPVYAIDDLTTNPACKAIRRFSLLQ